jgi:hypothetical protein
LAGNCWSADGTMTALVFGGIGYLSPDAKRACYPYKPL